MTVTRTVELVGAEEHAASFERDLILINTVDGVDWERLLVDYRTTISNGLRVPAKIQRISVLAGQEYAVKDEVLAEVKKALDEAAGSCLEGPIIQDFSGILQGGIESDGLGIAQVVRLWNGYTHLQRAIVDLIATPTNYRVRLGLAQSASQYSPLNEDFWQKIDPKEPGAVTFCQTGLTPIKNVRLITLNQNDARDVDQAIGDAQQIIEASLPGCSVNREIIADSGASQGWKEDLNTKLLDASGNQIIVVAPSSLIEEAKSVCRENGCHQSLNIQFVACERYGQPGEPLNQTYLEVTLGKAVMRLCKMQLTQNRR